MVKCIIEKTQKISSKITKFIWFFVICKFFKSDKYFETEVFSMLNFKGVALTITLKKKKNINECLRDTL